MATIDASIPLQAQTPQQSPLQGVQQAYTLADTINKQKQDQVLRQTLSAPGAIDPSTGQVTPQTLAAVTKVNPQAGMTLQKNAADIAEKQSTTTKNTAQAKNFDFQNGIKQMDLVAQSGGAVMAQYNQLVKQGVPPDQAKAQVQPLYEQGIEKLKASGQIDAQHLSQIPQQFDPVGVANGVFSALSAKDQFAVQHQQNQEGLEQDKFGESQRHNRADEGLKGQSNAIAGMNAGTNRERLGFEESKPQTEVGKLNADFHSGKISESDYKAGVTKATGSGDPAAIESVAKGIADGTLPPLTGNAMRTPGGMRTMARVMELNPEYDSKDYGGASKAVKDFSTGKNGNTVRSLNVSMAHLDTLSDLSKELKNGNTPAFNQIANRLAAETGHPAPTNFDAAKKIVADEIVKGIVGSGGGVSDREEAAKAINAANSPAQLAGVIGTYKKLLGGQLEGLQKQYETSTGKKDFKTRFLTPQTASLEGGAAPLPGQGAAPAAVKPPLPAGTTPPTQNAQGWTLHKDKSGNMAYVSPDGKQFQALQ